MKEPQDNQLSSISSAPENNASTWSTCECVEDRIHELLDHRQALLSDEIVRDHISECDPCAQLVIDLGALNDSMSQIPLATLHRLSGLQGEEVETTEKSSKSTHPVLFVASIACLMLVMLTSGIWFGDQPEQVAVVSSFSQSETASVPKMEGIPELEEVSVPETIQQLGLVTVHKTSPPTEFIHAVSFRDLSDDVEPYQDYIGMTADLPGIRPVSTSFNATFHLIKSISEQPRPAP